MATDPFSSPSSGQKVTDFSGRLLLIYPTEFLEDVPTVHGDTDCIEANLIVLDGEDAPLEVSGIRIFQKVLIGQLRPKVGKSPVLGTLGTRPATKKGQSDAWALVEATEDQKQLARDYMAAKDPFSV